MFLLEILNNIVVMQDKLNYIYNQIHYEQLKLIRIGLKSELLQNGLRKQVIDIIKASAKGEFDEALELARKY